MNLFINGVDPELDISDIDALRRTAEYCNRLPGPPAPPVRRRPRLHVVLRVAPGRDQEGLRGARPDDYDQWGVPYLPIDPKHVGRSYEAVIRVNSQSGKGGVAYVMKAEHGFDLPRRLQIEFSKTIQHITEDSGTEISPLVMWDAFRSEYMPDEPTHRLRSHELHTKDGDARRSAPSSTSTAAPITVTGDGEGPIEAFVHGLCETLDTDVRRRRLRRARDGPGRRRDRRRVRRDAPGADGQIRWGIGTDPEHHDRIAARRALRLRAPAR